MTIENMERLNSIDEIVEKYCVASSTAKSRVYVGLGCLFLVFAIIGIWVPGWPTVSWAVPAAFLFSLSSEGLFRYTLTNRYFGPAMFDYYATGKTLPAHAKKAIMLMIGLMSSLSSYFVWHVSTRGDGELLSPSTWNGADPGFGAASIILVGLAGIFYVRYRVNTRD